MPRLHFAALRFARHDGLQIAFLHLEHVLSPRKDDKSPGGGAAGEPVAPSTMLRAGSLTRHSERSSRNAGAGCGVEESPAVTTSEMPRLHFACPERSRRVSLGMTAAKSFLLLPEVTWVEGFASQNHPPQSPTLRDDKSPAEGYTGGKGQGPGTGLQGGRSARAWTRRCGVWPTGGSLTSKRFTTSG
jgi:hypothetical protein